MKVELVFRAIFAGSAVALGVIRGYWQSRRARGPRETAVRDGNLGLIAGAVAALAALVFGLEYIVDRGVFTFAYGIAYPLWLRALGAVALAGGVALLAQAHTHLGDSFHSLIVARPGQQFVDTGPYRCIRHPIYLAYLLSYLVGGLVASNWVLTLVPAVLYLVFVTTRVGREEAAMVELFGERYIEYVSRTGGLFPRFVHSRGEDLDGP